VNQTVDSTKTSVLNNIKSFAEAAKAASKFTFQAFLVKKTKKQPTAVIKEEKPKQLEIEEILVCSSSSTPAPMQYEEFCGKLFVKDDEAYTYETAKYENIVEETSKKASAKGKRSDEILKLVGDKANLENKIKTLTNDFNRKIMEYCEELDEGKVQNALFQNEISLLNANLTNLTQEHEEKINILKEEVIRKQNEITLANEALNELNTKFNRKLDEISDLNNQYDEYQ
jgi:chromosome segregation ATPase